MEISRRGPRSEHWVCNKPNIRKHRRDEKAKEVKKNYQWDRRKTKRLFVIWEDRGGCGHLNWSVADSSRKMYTEHCPLALSSAEVIVGLEKSRFSAVVGKKPYWVVPTLLRSFAAIRNKDMGSSLKERWGQVRTLLTSVCANRMVQHRDKNWWCIREGRIAVRDREGDLLCTQMEKWALDRTMGACGKGSM